MPEQLKPQLSKDQFLYHMENYKTNGDLDSRALIAETNIRSVWKVTQRFLNRGYEPEDLFQIGFIGLLKAIDKFDMSYGVAFSTYSFPMMIGEIQRFLRDDNWIKVSRSAKTMFNQVRKFKEEFYKEHTVMPTIPQIAEGISTTQESVIYAIEANQLSMSIHETVYDSYGDDGSITLEEQIPDEDSTRNYERVLLHDALTKLKPREQEIVQLRFFQDKTQGEVGQLFGISQVQISRLEKKILAQLRQSLTLTTV